MLLVHLATPCIKRGFLTLIAKKVSLLCITGISRDQRFFAQVVLGVKVMGSNVLGTVKIVYR